MQMKINSKKKILGSILKNSFLLYLVALALFVLALAYYIISIFIFLLCLGFGFLSVLEKSWQIVLALLIKYQNLKNRIEIASLFVNSVFFRTPLSVLSILPFVDINQDNIDTKLVISGILVVGGYFTCKYIVKSIYNFVVQKSQVQKADASVQTDLVESPMVQTDVSVQTDPMVQTDFSVQTDPMVQTDFSVQTDPMVQTDVSVQTDLCLGNLEQTRLCNTTTQRLHDVIGINEDVIVIKANLLFDTLSHLNFASQINILNLLLPVIGFIGIRALVRLQRWTKTPEIRALGDKDPKGNNAGMLARLFKFLISCFNIFGK